MAVKVIIAEDHRIMREGLRALLDGQEDIKVVGEAKNGLEVLQLVRECAPHVVIMDVAMPGLNGIEATRQVLAEATGVKVVALSMISSRRWVTEMLEAGASGYLLKSDCTIEEMVRCVHTVLDGKMYLSSGITHLIVNEYLRNRKGDGSMYSQLTSREREVFQLTAEGKTIREIASILNLSRKTVETHRRRVMAKLNTKSVNQLMRYAVQEGIPIADTIQDA